MINQLILHLDGWHFKHTNSGYIMPEIKFVSKTNGASKSNYSFRMNIIRIFEIKSCIEILENDTHN